MPLISGFMSESSSPDMLQIDSLDKCLEDARIGWAQVIPTEDLVYLKVVHQQVYYTFPSLVVWCRTGSALYHGQSHREARSSTMATGSSSLSFLKLIFGGIHREMSIFVAGDGTRRVLCPTIFGHDQRWINVRYILGCVCCCYSSESMSITTLKGQRHSLAIRGW